MRKRIRLLTGSSIAALILLGAALVGGVEARPIIAPDLDPQESAQVLGVSSLPALLPSEDPSAAPEIALHPLEAQLLDLLNGDRLARGIPPLELDARLLDLARQRSNDMAARSYFSHVTPEGTMVFDQMNALGIPYRLAGENLARNHESPDVSPQVAHQGFMNSPAHARNDYDPTFNRVGIGMSVTEGGAIYFTELFAALD
ncbi:MAG: CAP domain-containing protein [Chloroflexota bacterium]